jgi:hypothetical protein
VRGEEEMVERDDGDDDDRFREDSIGDCCPNNNERYGEGRVCFEMGIFEDPSSRS